LLLVPGAALCALGADGVYQASRGGTPVAIDCAEFARAHPASNRLLLTGCAFDYRGAGYRGPRSSPSELFVPALPAGTYMPAPLVIASRDPAVLAAAHTLVEADEATPPDQARAAEHALATLLTPSTAIDGLARSGLVERFRSRRILSGLARPIADDAVIVDLGGRASFMRPVLTVLTGLLLFVLPFGSRWRQRPADQPAGNEDGHRRLDGAAGAGPAPAGARTPRLLLLNVDRSAGPDAIERAPPLGGRQEVVEILRGVVPDLRTGSASHLLVRPDGSLTLDLGIHDPIPTVVMDARSEGGVALVKEILRMTGWRAFSPKTGLFVTADDLTAIEALTDEQDGLGPRS
jgi:hypothetical protein